MVARAELSQQLGRVPLIMTRRRYLANTDLPCLANRLGGGFVAFRSSVLPGGGLARVALRPDLQRCFRQDLLLCGFAERKRPEFGKIVGNFRHAWAGPIRTEERLVRDLFQAREVFQQRLRRYA